ncbi:MAG: hypothetical protein PWR10_1032 [Halanaerobiales bacterium]|nr:hypothetical protein [Halanaerobiales bacterium]
MTKRRLLWVVWLVILILSAYIVPYILLHDVNKITGAFLYWTLFALIAIFSTIKIINYWRD